MSISVLKQWHGKDLQFDGTYTVPESGEGWLLNFTDVAVQIQFLDGESVTMQIGQTITWGDANAGQYDQFLVIISGMGSGMVSYSYAK